MTFDTSRTIPNPATLPQISPAYPGFDPQFPRRAAKRGHESGSFAKGNFSNSSPRTTDVGNTYGDSNNCST
ncbi:hypothetical protein H9L39_18748 [Fusarium oxysporum f. sp. albedinis]|nr:hypothetical protein H9L39_18748 [Fusarium oxysporum f. sp. albedinis]